MDNTPLINIKAKAVSALKWESLNHFISKAGQPLLKLALVRILAPGDFGVLAAATIVIGLARMLQSLGMERALIRAQDKIDESANIVFWTNLLFSIFLYLLIVINLPLFSKFFRAPIMTDALKILSFQLIIYSFTIVHQALFQRNLQFKQLFFVRLLSLIVLSAVTITMALLHYGVWSLIFGNLAGCAAEALLFWSNGRWRPKWAFDFKLAGQLFSFGRSCVISNLLCWIVLNIDLLIISRCLGIKTLGIYQTGTLLIIVLFDMIFGPLSTVVYPIFSRLKSDPEELKGLLLKIARFAALVFLPIDACVFILAKPASLLIFGPNWQGIDMVISLSALALAFSVLIVSNACAYEAIGRPDINAKLRLLDAICFVFAYTIAAPYGLFIFLITRLVLFIFDIGMRVAVADKVLKLPATHIIKTVRGPLIGSLISGISAYSCIYLNTGLSGIGEWIKIIWAAGIFFVIYILFIWLAEKELFRQSVAIFRSAVKSRN